MIVSHPDSQHDVCGELPRSQKILADAPILDADQSKRVTLVLLFRHWLAKIDSGTRSFGSEGYKTEGMRQRYRPKPAIPLSTK